MLHEIEGDDVDDDPMHLLMVLGVEPADDVGKPGYPCRSSTCSSGVRTTWTSSTCSAGARKRSVATSPPRVSRRTPQIARIADGLPGFVAELVDWLGLKAACPTT